MTHHTAVRGLVRHDRIVVVAISAGVATLVGFRVLIEFGLGPRGSLRIFGLPLEYACLGWFLALWAVASDRRKLAGCAALRATAYEWVLGVLGLAGVLWLMQRLGTYRFVVSEAWVYPFAALGAALVFVSASTIDRTESNLGHPRHVLFDAVRIFSRPTTWACAIAIISTLAFAPRSFEMPTDGAAFRRWYLSQERQEMPARWAPKKVTLIELTDYQCPACREAAIRYQEVIRKTLEEHGILFAFLRVDFPLDNECNSLSNRASEGEGLHPAACEAAAAVRLAKSEGADLERRVIDWLWANQRQLTPNAVFEQVEGHFGLNVRQQYAALLPSIGLDAAEGRRLKVTGTPTYFLNGRRLPLVAASTLETAIAIEIEIARNELRGIQE